MPDDKFKLPQSSYEELTKIIKAYGHFSEPVDLDHVSKLVGIHGTIISGNAGFLIGIGILEPASRKILTSNGRSLAHALEHDMPDEIRAWWSRIISGSDFLTRLQAAVRIRNGMDQQTLEAHIAYSAGQPKKAQFMTGARTIIDILRAAELIREMDGKYVSSEVQSVLREVISTGGDVLLTPTVENTPQQPCTTVVCSPQPTAQLSPVITIQININCSAAEVPDLAGHIKRLMEELHAPTPDMPTKEERGK